MPPALDAHASAASIPWFNNSWLDAGAPVRRAAPSRPADRGAASSAASAPALANAASHHTRRSSSGHTLSTLSLIDRVSLISFPSSAAGGAEPLATGEEAVAPTLPGPEAAVALARQASEGVQVRIVQVRLSVEKRDAAMPMG